MKQMRLIGFHDITVVLIFAQISYMSRYSHMKSKKEIEILGQWVVAWQWQQC